MVFLTFSGLGDLGDLGESYSGLVLIAIDWHLRKPPIPQDNARLLAEAGASPDNV
jgi:hypothetical protein